MKAFLKSDDFKSFNLGFALDEGIQYFYFYFKSLYKTCN